MRDLVNKSVALQLSGHLRRYCSIGPTARHVAACRETFARCDVFVHTWSELEPTTPHYLGVRSSTARLRPLRPMSTNASSAVCVGRLRARLAKLGVAAAVEVEVQPPPPAEDSPAPDGLPFLAAGVNSSRTHWGAARHHGWRMNLRGIARAAALRRAAAAAEGHTYELSVRLRPDDSIRGTVRVHEPAAVGRLWACLGLYGHSAPALAAAPRPPNPRWQSEAWWAKQWQDFERQLSPCGERALKHGAADNCLVARPAALDRVLAVFDDAAAYATVYSKQRRKVESHDVQRRDGIYWPEMQIPYAAAMARPPVKAAVEMLCHRDALAAGSTLALRASGNGTAAHERIVQARQRMREWVPI